MKEVPTRHPFVALREDSLLLLVDIQQALLKAVPAWPEKLGATLQLIRATEILGVPVLVTEHYRKGLGGTIAEVASELDGAAFFQKEHFSSCLEEGFLETVRSFGRGQVVVAGMEAHVCVLQTALDLLQAGYQVHLVKNAVASRREEDRVTALDLLREAGAVVTSAEIVVFQWARRSNSEEFRRLLPLVK